MRLVPYLSICLSALVCLSAAASTSAATPGSAGSWGAVSSGFLPEVFALAEQDDGRILVGGNFEPSDLVRLNHDGTLDPEFSSSVLGLGAITALQIQEDRKILLAGNRIYRVNGSYVKDIARVNPSGATDVSFQTLPNGGSSPGYNHWPSLALQADGRIVVGGFNPIEAEYGSHVARFLSNGLLDGGLTPPELISGSIPFSPEISAVAIQEDGKLLVAGWFAKVAGVSRRGVYRLNADGSFDPTFRDMLTSGDSDTRVSDVKVLPGGNILVSGAFTRNGKTANGTARLLPDGTLDSSFASQPVVGILELQEDGKILIAQDTHYRGALSRDYPGSLTRLLPSGQIDPTFVGPYVVGADAEDPGYGHNLSLRDVFAEPDGKILIGGLFNSVDGHARRGIARLNSDGTVERAEGERLIPPPKIEVLSTRVVVGARTVSIISSVRSSAAGSISQTAETVFGHGDSEVCRSKRKPSQAGVYRLECKVSGRSWLRKYIRKRAIRLSLKTTFQSSEGAKSVPTYTIRRVEIKRKR